MSQHNVPGHSGPLLTDDDVTERCQAILVFIIATAAMLVVRLTCPHLHSAVSLIVGIMVFWAGAIDIILFKEINRFERQLRREGYIRPF